MWAPTPPQKSNSVFLLSNAFTGSAPEDFCRSQFSAVRTVWTPTLPDLLRYKVNFVQDGTYTPIVDQSNRFRLIEIRLQTGSPQILEL